MKICFFSSGKRLVYVVIFCFLVAILLIVLSFKFIFKAAEESKSILDYASANNFEKLKDYYLEYELTVYGNKSINKYNYKETYKIQDDYNEYFKFEIEDETFGTMSYEISNNMLKISSTNQLNIYNIENYSFSKCNLYSLSTFFNIYYDIKNAFEDNSSYIYNEEYDDYIILGIKFGEQIENESINSNYKAILNNNGINIKKLELYISKEDYNLRKLMGIKNDDTVYFEVNYLKSIIN